MTLFKKKYILLVLLIANILMVGANDLKEFDPNEGDQTSFYEYKEVLTSEDNFKNLFYNIPKYAKGGDMVDFLSYEYVGIIKNKRQTKKYLKKNFKHYPHFAWGISLSGSGLGVKDVETIVQLMPSSHDTDKLEEKDVIKTISEVYVGLGFEVYEIRFVYGLKIYSQYVFVNPDTKEVVLEGNVFGMKVPLTHFEYFDSQNK